MAGTNVHGHGQGRPLREDCLAYPSRGRIAKEDQCRIGDEDAPGLVVDRTGLGIECIIAPSILGIAMAA
jgi:hypothetical protein